MFIKLNEKMHDDEGFTLIELMVVVLIIAILIAIAIPAFLGARKRAQRRQAQSSLRNTLTTEKTYYSDVQSYTSNSGALSAIEPALSYTTGASTGPNQISVGVSTDGQAVELGAWSKSKDCYWIYENAAAGVTYGKTEDGNQTSCAANTTAASASGATTSTSGW